MQKQLNDSVTGLMWNNDNTHTDTGKGTTID